jgi:hypothetical protein
MIEKRVEEIVYFENVKNEDLQRSTEWVKKAQGRYELRKGCLLVAAKGVRGRRSNTYLQLLPGNEKVISS